MAWCGEEVVCITCVLVGRSLQDIEVEKVDPRCGPVLRSAALQMMFLARTGKLR